MPPCRDTWVTWCPRLRSSWVRALPTKPVPPPGEGDREAVTAVSLGHHRRQQRRSCLGLQQHRPRTWPAPHSGEEAAGTTRNPGPSAPSPNSVPLATPVPSRLPLPQTLTLTAPVLSRAPHLQTAAPSRALLSHQPSSLTAPAPSHRRSLRTRSLTDPAPSRTPFLHGPCTVRRSASRPRSLNVPRSLRPHSPTTTLIAASRMRRAALTAHVPSSAHRACAPAVHSASQRRGGPLKGQRAPAPVRVRQWAANRTGTGLGTQGPGWGHGERPGDTRGPPGPRGCA